jgi:hypothetical protein
MQVVQLYQVVLHFEVTSVLMFVHTGWYHKISRFRKDKNIIDIKMVNTL